MQAIIKTFDVGILRKHSQELNQILNEIESVARK